MEIIVVKWGLGYAAFLVYSEAMEGDRAISTPSDGLGDGIQKIRALHG